MNTQPQHEMILEEVYPSGTEEWYCPICDRRLLIMTWHPDGKQCILNHGNEYSHSDMQTKSSPEIFMNDRHKLGVNDEERLAVWMAWLTKVDFDSWWKNPNS